MSKTNPGGNSPLRILLVEDEPAVCDEFASCIAARSGMELIGVTNSSYKAIELIRSHRPEVLILDLELNKGSGNGLMVLEDMKSLDDVTAPYTVITTNNTSHTTYETAHRYGAGFIFTKHQDNYSPDSVLNFIHLVEPTIREERGKKTGGVETETPAALRQRLRKLICMEYDRLGMSTKVIGYDYLVEAVCISIERPTPNLGMVIGKMYDKSAPSVERAMKNAIEKAWDTIPLDVLTANYTARINPDRGVPTVMEFISYYTDKLKNICAEVGFKP